MLYQFIKNILFQFDPELIHDLTFKNLKMLTNTPLKFLIKRSILAKQVNCMGIIFKNPLGLAAGLDKNGEYIDLFNFMGFGFIEVGTTTPKAQFGNNKPRLFRLIQADGLINHMGFNNFGVDNLIENIKKSNFKGVLGINISKNTDTPIEKSIDDYLFCIERVYSYATYIVINISSPNTPKLRVLQFGILLDNILQEIKYKKSMLQIRYGKCVPILIKISPDLTEKELIKLADSLIRNKIDGIIATNTTITRHLVQGLKYFNETGGLSGRPLQLLSTNIINNLSKELKGKIPIIGVGGIDSLIAAREKIAAGASLIQICSGLIFHGLKLVNDIVKNI